MVLPIGLAAAGVAAITAGIVAYAYAHRELAVSPGPALVSVDGLTVTLRVYAHVIRDQVAEAADVFARSIPPADAATISESVSKKVLGEKPQGL